MDSRQILIRNAQGSCIGTLKAIDEELIKDQSLIVLMTSWRKRFKLNFLTQFEPTVERTERWLREIVLKDNTRILFIIFDDKGHTLGHCGACNISKYQAELDNVLRGEKGSEPDFMFYSVTAVLEWLYETLNLDRVVLRVFSNNERAIHLYQRLGFFESQRFNLTKVQEGEEIRYLVGSNQGAAVDFQYIEMSLERSHFKSARGV